MKHATDLAGFGRHMWTASGANAQTQLNAYADKDGYIDVQALTCAQLANTFQEDAS